MYTISWVWVGDKEKGIEFFKHKYDLEPEKIEERKSGNEKIYWFYHKKLEENYKDRFK